MGARTQGNMDLMVELDSPEECGGRCRAHANKVSWEQMEGWEHGTEVVGRAKGGHGKQVVEGHGLWIGGGWADDSLVLGTK